MYKSIREGTILKSKIIIKSIIFFIILGTIFYCFNKFNLYAHIKDIFSSPQNFKDFVINQGALAPLVFFLIQIGQVIISPIPGNLTALAGGALFGGISASLLSSSGIILGSLIAFYLARAFGKPLVVRFVGQSIFDKYSKVFSGKSCLSLFILFLLPFFPDDALCFLAGLSNMNFRLFLILTIFGRLPNIVFASLIGSGVISFSLITWIIIGVVSAILLFLLFRYKNKIENWLYNRLGFE